YIAVLIDDLVTKGTREPYRMFTSRAEYRLLLRHDNADHRLMEVGHRIGLLPESAYRVFLQKRKRIDDEIKRLKKTRVKAAKINAIGFLTSEETADQTLEQLLKRPELGYERIEQLSRSTEVLSEELKGRVEIEIKYEGYILRQLKEVERFKKMENRTIPERFNYNDVTGLSREVCEKLSAIRPISVGQASRISGITPAALSILLVALERNRQNPQSVQGKP
ncbi:MAG: tRNA uridine-5-carboxymethylaminomethyl(34) synthesis enzyme MnmG, partial [Nitrospirae bacterium]|nr:tRNA uridine-5-carboxymethylaminomethyl(34) synthesis enzyme MnmG [Nitrospirota bacterium]